MTKNKKYIARSLVVVYSLLFLAVIGYVAFAFNKFGGCDHVLGIEYWKLQSLGSELPVPAAIKTISGPTRGCGARGLGRVISVAYVMEAPSKDSYLAAEAQYRDFLLTKKLTVVSTASDQLYMSRSRNHGVDVAFMMRPIRTSPNGVNSVTTLEGIAKVNGPYRFSVTVQDADQ